MCRGLVLRDGDGRIDLEFFDADDDQQSGDDEQQDSAGVQVGGRDEEDAEDRGHGEAHPKHTAAGARPGQRRGTEEEAEADSQGGEDFRLQVLVGVRHHLLEADGDADNADDQRQVEQTVSVERQRRLRGISTFLDPDDNYCQLIEFNPG